MAERVLLLRDGQRLPRVRLAVALVLAVILGGPGGMPARAQSQASIDYLAAVLWFVPTLCTGETEEIHVGIRRYIEPPSGEIIGAWISGGTVGSFIYNESVGHFDPEGPGVVVIRDVVGQPLPEAVYKFVADKPGQTDIDFIIGSTGEEATHGSGWPTTVATVRVEVTDCYEAHTSGLAAIFTDKDMGGLNKWFLLSGYTPNVNGVTTDTQVMFFIPNPQDRLHGHYAHVDLAYTVIGNLQSACIAYISGRYDVAFNIPPGQPEPPGADVGDLVMFGSGDVFCNGRFAAHLDYRSSPGFLIAFKPKPPP
jgi:hypothetical protein